MALGRKGAERLNKKMRTSPLFCVFYWNKTNIWNQNTNDDDKNDDHGDDRDDINDDDYQRVEATQRSTCEGVKTNVTILKETCPILIEAQAWEGHWIKECKREVFEQSCWIGPKRRLLSRAAEQADLQIEKLKKPKLT